MADFNLHLKIVSLTLNILKLDVKLQRYSVGLTLYLHETDFG